MLALHDETICAHPVAQLMLLLCRSRGLATPSTFLPHNNRKNYQSKSSKDRIVHPIRDVDNDAENAVVHRSPFYHLRTKN
jgi:hypothetical protein